MSQQTNLYIKDNLINKTILLNNDFGGKQYCNMFLTLLNQNWGQA